MAYPRSRRVQPQQVTLHRQPAAHTRLPAPPVFSNYDLITDHNTLMNCYIAPPAWATDDYRERREAPRARLQGGFATPSSGAAGRPQITQFSMPRSSSSMTSSSTPGSSGGGTYYTHYGHHRHQIPPPFIYEVRDDSEDDSENDSEDEASEPGSTESPDPPSTSAIGVYGPRSYYYGRHPRPLSHRHRRAAVATSQPSRPAKTQKGFKKVVHRVLSRLGRKPPSSGPPPTTTDSATVSIAAGASGTFMTSSAPRNTYDSRTCYTYDSRQYYTGHRLNTSASIPVRTHNVQQHMAQPHPLTSATMHAAERVERARRAGCRELEDITRWTNDVRQVHEWRDGVVVGLMKIRSERQ